MNEAIHRIDKLYANYKISEALMAVYKLIWDDFCSWFLEMVKPPYQQPIDKITYDKTLVFFDDLMKLAHPFMPFISEEIWQMLLERKEGQSIMNAPMPVSGHYDKELLTAFETEEEVIINVRNLRQSKNIPNREQVALYVKKNYQEKPDHTFDSVIKKLCNISEIRYVDEKPSGAVSFLVKSTEFYIPLGSSVDIDAEIMKLEEELNYTRGFLEMVIKKLSNERFVNHAPADVVQKERQKQSDAEGRISVIEEQIRDLKR
jgi:valyl-tRNA synthetase